VQLPRVGRTRLRFLDGRSIRDTADEMGITVSNAKVLQHRALKAAAKAGV
jgi:DNA-directed RNA polymerase specialized sigma24 family protein